MPLQSENKEKRKKTGSFTAFFVKYRIETGLILLGAVLIPLCMVWPFYSGIIEQEREKMVETAHHQSRFSEEKFFEMTDDFIFLMRLFAAETLLCNYASCPTEKNRSLLEAAWLKVANEKKIYSRIRFIGLDGSERVRIDSSPEGAKAVAESGLQGQAKRDYYRGMQQLAPGEVGFFCFDLEQEHGKAVKPYKIAFRMASPVVVRGTKLGYLLINLDTPYIINHYFRDELIPHSEMELISTEGFYIFQRDKNALFGGTVSSRSRFNISKERPQLWQRIKENNRESDDWQDGGTTYVWDRVCRREKYGWEGMIQLKIIPQQSIKEGAAESIRQFFLKAVGNWFLFLTLGGIILTLFILEKRRNLDATIGRLITDGELPFAVYNRDGLMVRVNKAAARLIGLSAEEILGKNRLDLLDNRFAHKFRLDARESLREKGFWQGELIFQHKDGHDVPSLVFVQPLVDSKGEYTHFVVALLNIVIQKQVENRLRELSEKDSLTGCYNRRIFDQRLEEDSIRLARYSEMTASLALFDIDHFKKVNDTYGHPAGDIVLKELAGIVQESIRNADLLARVGGEEFGLILPYTTIDAAMFLLERIRLRIAGHDFILDDGTVLKITVSMGAVELCGGVLGEAAYDLADDLLYEAKKSGRNRVCIAEGEKPKDGGEG